MENINNVVAALQLLAQRQELREINTKTQVIFYTQVSKDNLDEAFATVSVQVLAPPIEAGKPYTFAREYKEIGITYEEAAKKLALQLLKPLQERHKDDEQVLALAHVGAVRAMEQSRRIGALSLGHRPATTGRFLTDVSRVLCSGDSKENQPALNVPQLSANAWTRLIRWLRVN